MAEHGTAPVAAGQAAHEGGHLLHRCQQRALAGQRLGQTAAHGRGVAAMARDSRRSRRCSRCAPASAQRAASAAATRQSHARSAPPARAAAAAAGRNTVTGVLPTLKLLIRTPRRAASSCQTAEAMASSASAAASQAHALRTLDARRGSSVGWGIVVFWRELRHSQPTRRPMNRARAIVFEAPRELVGARTGAQARRGGRCRGRGGLQRHQHRHRAVAVGRQHAALSGAGLSAGAGLRDRGHGAPRRGGCVGAGRRLGVRARLLQLCRRAQHLRRRRLAPGGAARACGARGAAAGPEGGAAGAGRHLLPRAVAGRAGPADAAARADRRPWRDGPAAGAHHRGAGPAGARRCGRRSRCAAAVPKAMR